MVWHQTVRMHVDAETIVADPEQPPELHAILVTMKGLLARDTPVHDVVPAVLDIDPCCSSHAENLDGGLSQPLDVHPVPGTGCTSGGGAELAVAGVAEAGHDEGVLVEVIVDRRR